MMKKLLLLGLMGLSTLAYGSTEECPATLTCSYTDGNTVCAGLDADWEVLTQMTSPSSTPAAFILNTVLWDGNNISFNNVSCQYINSRTASFFSLDRTDGATVLYPDMSQQWGWVWTSVDRTTARCHGVDLVCLLTTIAA